MEKLKESDLSASLSSMMMLLKQELLIALEKELSDPSHPHINDAGCSGTEEVVNPRDVMDAVSPHGAHGTGFGTPHKLPGTYRYVSSRQSKRELSL